MYRRLVAAALVPVLVGVSVVAGTLHVHAGGDRDHLEHRHGPAAHDHSTVEARATGGGSELDHGNSARHVVGLSFFSITVPHTFVADADVQDVVIAAPPHITKGAIARSEVRSHGPPLLPAFAPRPPPSRVLPDLIG